MQQVAETETMVNDIIKVYSVPIHLGNTQQYQFYDERKLSDNYE
jgi:hypothetical protein